jgi:AcrR family transcriptional regulator
MTLDEVKQLILDKAQIRVERFGFKKTTMDEISKDCNISKKTIYEYFEDKEDLFQSLLRRECHKTLDLLFDQLTKVTDPADKLALLIKTAISHFTQDNFITKMVKDDEMFFNFMGDNCHGFIDDEIISRLAGIIEEGIEQGKFRQVDAQLVAYAGLKLFESFSYQRTSILFEEQGEEYCVGVLLDFIMHALVKPDQLVVK